MKITSSFINHLLSLIVFLSIPLCMLAQQSDLISIKWNEPQLINYEGVEIYLPSIDGQQLDGKTPNFYWRKKIKISGLKPVLELISTVPATQKELNYLNDYDITVDILKQDLAISNAGKSKYVVLNLFPYVLENNTVVRISQVKINYEPIVVSPLYANKDFVASSVMSNGEWYKISVDRDGLYKINKQFLEDLGIDIDNVNPQDINIYGNGDGRLPELNSIPRTDDLAKNAIQIIGESDGVFDDSDYILFYGWGPHRWSESGGIEFRQDRHIYSDISCYFININSSNTPLRVSSITSSVNPVSNPVNSYSYYDVHELDLVNLVNGGQRWYGELFDTDLEKTILFNVPDVIVGTPAEIEVSIASSESISTGSSQTYSVNGTQIYSSTLPTSSEFGRSVSDMTLNSPSSSIPLKISIVRNSPSTLTYLDKITLNARRSLSLSSSQINFRDLASVGVGNVSEYTLVNLPSLNGFVWEITNRHEPSLIMGSFVGLDYVFQSDADSLREFVASNGVNYFTPQPIGLVENQNLHLLAQVDYLIVTHKAFTNQAERLADLHRAKGLTVHVVNTEQIYNEFSSGMTDATAIRSFAKMFWDRGALAPSTRPKHLLLFGDGTFDPKNRVPNNNNFVLTYQVLNSENHIAAMPSDDFFGLLDDSDAILSTDLVDIGIGRLLISNNETAIQQVDKIQHYMNNGSTLFTTGTSNCNAAGGSSTFGDWRLKYVQIADDEEGNYFLNIDVEPQFTYVSDSFPEMNCEKIYLDAYQQVSTAGGERYPDVNDAIDSKIQRGALVVNYVGHGGEVGMAEERVITVPQIQGWRGVDVLPLFVSATCEFTKFDDPYRVSAGEWASLNPYGAAIALMTTTRSVYFGTNTQIGKEFYKNVFRRDANNKPITFGEIITETKNAVGGDNKRSFTLIGDPALTIALPEMRIVTDSINGLDPMIQMDTINALSKVTIKGHIENYTGSTLTGFNGILFPSVFDKPKEQKTLSNDGAASPELTFYTQTNRVYSGKASVVNGMFEFTFVVPKDINYAIDFGKISYYAEDGTYDAAGFDTLFYIGGIDPAGLDDNEGPQIDLYLNDENFVDGGLSNETPILIAQLFDENGINTVGNGIGHDLLAVLDGETGNPIVLNDFYTADLDSYQSGEVRYTFGSLEKGEHTLYLKAWDVNNNSSETTIHFVVQEKEEMTLDHVLNYPNPFTTHTEFYFEHNQVCSNLEVQIQIITVAGRLVRTINTNVHTEGFRSEGIAWDGRDDFGGQLAKGVYVYRIKVKSPDGSIAEKLEKLVILK